MIEIDERVGRPELLAQLVAADDVAGPLEQEQQDIERPAAEAERPPLFAQLTGPRVGFEEAESIDRLRRRWVGHSQ